MPTRFLRRWKWKQLVLSAALGLFLASASAAATANVGQAQSDSILTVIVDGAGHVTSRPAGIDCLGSGTCRRGFATNEKVTLTASVELFKEWDGACITPSNVCVVRLDADKSVTALYARPTLAASQPPPPPPPPIGSAPPPKFRARREPSRIFRNAVRAAVAGLRNANISYNAPTTLHLGETTEIQLLLSPRHTISQLKENLTGIGERRGAKAKFSDIMEAHLTGINFKIEAITSEDQVVDPDRPTEWRWAVEPTKSGNQRLHLTLSAFVLVADTEKRYRIDTYDTPLEINVTWSDRISSFLSQNWQWVWAVILVPLAGWAYRNRKRWRLS